MNHLLFKILNTDYQYAIVSPKVLYLITDSEYVLLNNSGNQNILKKATQLKKERISHLIITQRNKAVSIYSQNDHELSILKFESHSLRKQFIDAFPDFEREFINTKTRIHPIAALLGMLFTYSFIWAGTRPTAADINPAGIRWRIAYLNVKLLEWLNGLIGKELLLIIGITLLFTLLYFIFRPELWNLFRKTTKYSNAVFV